MVTTIAALFLFLFASTDSAQTRENLPETAKLAGIITDLNDARISEAKILITGNGIKRDFVTDDEGFFQGNLPPGLYTVAITHYGFRPSRRRIFLKSNTVTPLKVMLRVPKPGKCPKEKVCL